MLKSNDEILRPNKKSNKKQKKSQILRPKVLERMIFKEYTFLRGIGDFCTEVSMKVGFSNVFGSCLHWTRYQITSWVVVHDGVKESEDNGNEGLVLVFFFIIFWKVCRTSPVVNRREQPRTKLFSFLVKISLYSCLQL